MPCTAVVDPRFCFPQQTMLIMQEQMGAFRNDNFTITDAAGRPFFNLQAASLSFTGSRQLLDVYNNPVLQMQKKVPSLRGSWLINRAADRVRVATVRPSTFSFTPCKPYSSWWNVQPMHSPFAWGCISTCVGCP